MNPEEAYLARLEAWATNPRKRRAFEWTPERRRQHSATMRRANAHLSNNQEWARQCSKATLQAHYKKATP